MIRSPYPSTYYSFLEKHLMRHLMIQFSADVHRNEIQLLPPSQYHQGSRNPYRSATLPMDYHARVYVLFHESDYDLLSPWQLENCQALLVLSHSAVRSQWAHKTFVTCINPVRPEAPDTGLVDGVEVEEPSPTTEIRVIQHPIKEQSTVLVSAAMMLSHLTLPVTFMVWDESIRDAIKPKLPVYSRVNFEVVSPDEPLWLMETHDHWCFFDPYTDFHPLYSGVQPQLVTSRNEYYPVAHQLNQLEEIMSNVRGPAKDDPARDALINHLEKAFENTRTIRSTIPATVSLDFLSALPVD